MLSLPVFHIALEYKDQSALPIIRNRSTKKSIEKHDREGSYQMRHPSYCWFSIFNQIILIFISVEVLHSTFLNSVVKPNK